MLALTYIPEDEWHGELRVEAAHAGFSGKASAWFNREDIRKFAADLRALANDHVAAAELKGGCFSDSTTSSTPVETHVGIRVARKKLRHVATVELADQCDAILPQRAVLQFHIEWAAHYWNANAIDALLEAGGTAQLKVSRNPAADPEVVKARHPIKRPYSPLFMDLRQQFEALIDRMEQKTPTRLPPSDRQMATEEWETYSPGAIIVQIDWDHARLLCNWGVGYDNPAVADRSPDYVLNLAALKDAAQSSEHPRACFESYAAHLIWVTQSQFIDFYRDGPTDDVPYERHLLFVRGLTGGPAQTWVSNMMFSYDEEQI
jgi:hypothetical protein